jgi:hypothetical protein
LPVTLIQGESGLSKKLIAQVGNDITKVWTIRDIEYIASQLQVEAVVEMDVSTQ